MTDYPQIHRDLSWLSFNARILMEAQVASKPIYERIKFLAIYSSNLDEFFRVRVGALQHLLSLNEKTKKLLPDSPEALLQRLYEEVKRQQEQFGKVFREEINPGLAGEGIDLLLDLPEDEEGLAHMREYFAQEILPFIHPELLLKGKVTHFLRNRAVYLTLRLVRKEGTAKKGRKRNWYAAVMIPSHRFPRFLTLPMRNGRHRIAFLDDVVRVGLDLVFPGFDIKACHSVKLSRNADLQIDDELHGSLPEKIRESLANRQVGAPTRFLYDAAMPEKMRDYLQDAYQLNQRACIPGGRYHNYSDFFGFPNPIGDKLASPTPPQHGYPPFDHAPDIFQAIAQQDHLLHFPYHCYDPVIRFLNDAANDPLVTRIQTTQYRVASRSAVVDALIRAAKNGKEVTVFVEIKARFDEAANLQTAQEMEKAGVQVVYSMPNLKVHAKVALVTRLELGEPMAYAFLSTGNFNEQTATLYGDHGLFTSNKKLTTELYRVFHFLWKKDKDMPPFKHLLVAQFNLKKALIAKVDQEIAHAKAGKKAYILIKLNNLEEPEMVEKLYQASQAGVHIDLIVRGICTLCPQKKGYSENIHATRIVDNYLEHARVFLFGNNGANDLFMGSADWMDRNLNRRVEVVFPIYNEQLKNDMIHLLNLQLQDNTQAVWLNENLQNLRKHPKENEAALRCQTAIYEWVGEQNKVI